MKKEVMTWEEKIHREVMRLQEENAELRLTIMQLKLYLFTTFVENTEKQFGNDKMPEELINATAYALMQKYMEEIEQYTYEIKEDYEQGRKFAKENPDFIKFM